MKTNVDFVVKIPAFHNCCESCQQSQYGSGIKAHYSSRHVLLAVIFQLIIASFIYLNIGKGRTPTAVYINTIIYI